MEMEKRHRKFAAVSKAIQPFTAAHEETDCDLLLVGITSTNGALEEARECLEAEGRKVNHIQLRLISPFPAEELCPYIEGAKKVLIVEEDLTAQLREQFAIRFDCHDKLLSLCSMTARRSWLRPLSINPRRSSDYGFTERL